VCWTSVQFSMILWFLRIIITIINIIIIITIRSHVGSRE
jgi:hypothetical protein